MNPLDQQVFNGTERFIIQQQLGAGAFGTVYQAYDKERNVTVALKVLKQTDAKALLRFKREFRALAHFTHPNLITLYELVSTGTVWFFTMELIRGVSFLVHVREPTTTRFENSEIGDFASTVRDRDAEGIAITATKTYADLNGEGAAAAPELPSLSVDVRRLREALLALAEGVSTLHSEGQIHRDIKPSNVMVTTEGRVVLLDFGLVTELAPVGFQASMTFAGTPAYMSPEQAAELPVTEASDWYCVGVMLYEALTGRLPFTGQFFEILANKQAFEPPSPSEIVAGVPEDLNDLCRELLSLSPSTRPTGPDILRRLRAQATTSPVTSTTAVTRLPTALVGREQHLRVLSQAFTATTDGSAVTVYLNGSSGMGKSILVNHFLERIRSNDKHVVVLTGRCYETESVPYKALDSFIDNLSRYLLSLSAAAVEAILPRDILALARLFPVLRQLNSVTSSRRRVLEVPDSQELRHRASLALRELLTRLADRQPTIIFLDDLQWGDLDSAALLNEILRPPEPPPLLLIAAYRSEEAETSQLIETLLGMNATYSEPVEIRQIEVKELSFSEARELAIILQGSESQLARIRAESIAQESGGNPFFINELVQYLQSHGNGRLENAIDISVDRRNTKLEAVINARVCLLPQVARNLLEVIAVAGRPLELDLAVKAANIESEDLSFINVLRANHLIRTKGIGRWSEIITYHDRIRETIVANLSTESLKAHHHRLAVALEKSGRADPEVLAINFQGSGMIEKAATYSELAAEEASGALAFERAARLYSRALELHDRTDESRTRDLRIKLADALANAGRSGDAADVYIVAAHGSPPSTSLELNRRAAEQLLRSGHVDKGLAIVKKVLEHVGMKIPNSLRSALAATLYRRAVIRLQGLDFRKRDVSEITAEDLMRLDICWSMAIGLARIDYIRAAYFQAIHLQLALQAGEQYRVVRALAAESGFSATAGWPGRKRSERFLRAVEAASQQVQHPHAIGLATFAPAFVAFYQGRFKDALESSERAEAIFREQCTGVTWEINTAQNYSLSSLVYMGELKELVRRVPIRLRESQERGDLYAITDIGAGRANIAWLVADDVGNARRAIAEALDQWSSEGFHYQHWLKLFSLSQADMYDLKGTLAWTRINETWRTLITSLTLRIQLIRIEAVHLRARSALAAIDIDAPNRNELLSAAARDAAKIESEQAPWGNPLAYLVQAGVSSSRGDSVGAVKLLKKAARGFDRADMKLFAAAARRRSGELIGGEEGKGLIENANLWLTSQNIKNPDRLLAMLAPGFTI